MNLQEQLTSLKEQNLSKFPEEIKSKLLEDLKKLDESGLVERAPKVGEKLKDFKLSNQLGKESSLTTLREKGPVVITFYRGGWCPYCNVELRAYQDIITDIKAAGATLVAITPELPDSSLTTAERHNVEFEVLTDINSDYARELGIVFTIEEELRPIYKQFGIELEKHNGEGQFDVPLAATFVIDTNGTITYTFVKADYTFRADPLDILKELQSLKK